LVERHVAKRWNRRACKGRRSGLARGDVGDGVAMSDRERLEIVQMIHEVIERLECARELSNLKLMKIRIEIARLKAKLRMQRRMLEGD
jgi:hypothetical protein